MTETVTLKRTSYGLSNFSVIRKENRTYVDKTRYIELLEKVDPPYQLIVRPRRFGKTLFTLTLQAYYDIAAAKDFERNFAGTYIGEHKTALANSFRIIHFDFSVISSDDFNGDFIDKVRSGLSSFCSTYKFKEGTQLINKDYPSAHRLFAAFIREYDNHFNESIYLIIDEYDQGANEALATSLESFKDLTRSGGILKTFYSQIKELASSGPIARVFITGVTSIQLDSMTSGFSIAENITNDARFATMFGFTESELKELIPQLVDLKKYGKTLDEVFTRMKEWYNGYCFNPKRAKTVFNSSMCLNYLKQINLTGEEPDNMLDPSFVNSLGKIETLFSLGDRDFICSIIDKALSRKEIEFSGQLETIDLNMKGQLDEGDILSSLFYMGFLTFVPGKREALCVPNRAIGIQFFEYYFKHVIQTKKYNFNLALFSAAYAALRKGDPGPWLTLVDKLLTSSSGSFLANHAREVAFQMMLSATLWASEDYAGQLELESRGENSGYIDLLLTPRENPKLPSYLIEIKHLHKEEASQNAIDTALRNAKEQAERYSVGEAVKAIPNLKRLAIVYVGIRLATFEVF